MTKKGASSSKTTDHLFDVSASVDAGQTSMPAQDLSLLEKARDHWQTGEWASLAALATTPLDAHPDKAKLALLAAVGLAQEGDLATARRFAVQAKDWGCDRQLIARIFIGGAYNSLGRAASLHDDEDNAMRYFEASVAAASPRGDTARTARTRNIYEKARLGLLPEAARLLGEELTDLNEKAALSESSGSARQSHLEAVLAEATRFPRSFDSLPEILHHVSSRSEARPHTRIIACCHHKSGTNFLLPLIRKVAEAFSLPLWLKFYDDEPAEWQICLHQHAHVSDIPETRTFRGIHLVRHPMSLIHSATLYHGSSCPEPWAHIPIQHFNHETFRALSSRDSYNRIKNPEVPLAEKRELMQARTEQGAGSDGYDSGYDFGGRTYSEMLESMPSFEERIRFEMHAYSCGVIRDMMRFPADNRFFQIRIEDISHDRSMIALQQMVAHLGFDGPSAATVLQKAAEGCLWNTPRPAHARTGMTESWREAFTESLIRDFRELFGWTEQALGYD